MSINTGIILASGSSARLEIINHLGYSLKNVAPQDVDETPLRGELPRDYVRRVARDKLDMAIQKFPNDIILCADTVAVVGRRILQKAQDAQEQQAFMRLMSGRRHTVFTHVTLYDPKKPTQISQRLVKTLVHMKPLSEFEIEAYVNSRVWEGCSGYRFNWVFQSFVKRLDGSVSCIAGLPVFETKALLMSAGCEFSPPVSASSPL